MCFGTARMYARTYLLSRGYFVFNILFRFTTGSWFKIVLKGFVATLVGVVVTRLCSGSNRFQPQPELRLS